MSFISPRPEQSDDQEIDLLSALNSLPVNGALAIVKIGPTKFSQITVGGNETDPLSIHLDQTTPSTFTGGSVTGTGLLQVAGGVLGKNVMLTVADTAPTSPNVGDLWIDTTN